MTTIATARPTIQRPEPAYLVDDAQLAGAAFLARYSGRTLDAYRHDLRGFFQWAADNAIPVLDDDAPPHRAVPSLDGATRPGRIDHRQAALDGLRVLPIRSHRRTDRVEPGPVRPPPTGPPLGRPRPGPLRARCVPFHGRAVRPRPRGACRAPGAQRSTGQRGVRHQRRGSWPRTRPPHPAHPRQGQRVRHRPARAPHRAPSTLPSANATRGRSCAAATGNASTAAPRIGGYEPLASGLAWGLSTRTCSGRRSSWRPSTPECPCATSRPRRGTPTRAPPPSTTDAGRTSTATLRMSSSPSSPAADPGRATSSGTLATSLAAGNLAFGGTCCGTAHTS